MFLKEIETITTKNINKSVLQGGWSNGTPTVSFMYNNTTGNILGTPRISSFVQEIKINPTIQTVINRQRSIITEADLKLFEDIKGTDKESNNEGANKLLEALLFPNTAPAMLSWNDIVKYFFHRYFNYGGGALVFTYDGDFQKDAKYRDINSVSNDEERMNVVRNNIRLLRNLKIQSIQPAQTVNYSTQFGKVEYKISLLNCKNNYNSEISFTQDEDLQGFFTAKSGDKFYIALIFGEFDFDTCKYETFLETIKPSILLENHIAKTNEAFYNNACMPSAILEVTPAFTDEKTVGYFNQKFGTSNEDSEKFKTRMQEIEAQIKGSINAGKTIVSKDPRVKFNVIPLQITPDATNAVTLTEIAKNNIYSFFAGGSRSAFEGTNEYASNAEPKLKELYDGALGFINTNLIDKLNDFLRLYLRVFRIAPPTQINNFYFSLDTSQIQFYKEYKKEELNLMYSQNQLTANEVRQKKGLLDDNLSDLTDLPNGDKLLIELSKSSATNLS